MTPLILVQKRPKGQIKGSGIELILQRLPVALRLIFTNNAVVSVMRKKNCLCGKSLTKVAQSTPLATMSFFHH